MRRSVCVRNTGGQDKKSTTAATVKLTKLRSSNRITELHHKNNMPVYNIIARRHKVFIYRNINICILIAHLNLQSHRYRYKSLNSRLTQ